MKNIIPKFQQPLQAQEMQQENSEDHNCREQSLKQVYSQQKQYQYLKKSSMVDGKFDLMFDKIKNTMVTQNFLCSAYTFLSYKLFNKSDKVKQPSSAEDKKRLQQELPMIKPIIEHNFTSAIRYTWIGHSTALIQIGKDNLIIDPVFSDRCSPSRFVGPLRYRKPACSISELKQVDMVLVSHDHYDHLDQTALNQLHKLYHPSFVAGLGSKDVFPKGSNMIEMDWMDTKQIKINNNRYEVTFVPVCHWSRRSAFDFNKRLWGGFVIKTPYNQKIFYSGDTAYTEVFKEIGMKFGPFDLAILPIGAYEPRELLAPQHVDPEQSVRIHQDIRSKKSVGVHWGTFPLGFQAFYQPKYDLEQAKVKLGIDKQAFVTVHHGESLVLE